MLYVLITDDPGRVRRLHDEPSDWQQAEFGTAAEALVWERAQERSGAIALESQGWKYGCSFTEERCRHSWVADVSAA